MNYSTLGMIMGVVGALYLLPSFAAVVRRRHNLSAIFTVNLLLGWTVIGWVVAAMWALKGVQWRSSSSSGWGNSGRKPCPSCGHSLRKTARRCRHCGYTLESLRGV